MRREFLTPALLTYYRDPIMIVEGWMQYLFDETGRRYLDCLAGIVTVSVGHCHPKVIDAVREQNERLQHATTIYLHPTIARFHLPGQVRNHPKQHNENAGHSDSGLALASLSSDDRTVDIVL